MPPALSDYDSDSVFNDPISTGVSDNNNLTPAAQLSQLDVRLSPKDNFGTTRQPLKTKVTFEESVKRNTSKGKKRSSALLDGLELRNIIPISDDEDKDTTHKDNSPASSVPVSSYKTRARAHRTSKSEICYDQKYHPMDEYIQPKRAAKMRSKYGEEVLSSDDGLIASSFGANKYVDSDSDSNESDSRTTKRRKLSSLQGTRRSSRQVNKDVLYNIKIHPQDTEIKMLEANEARVSKRDRHRQYSDNTSADEESKDESDNRRKKVVGDGANDMDRIIPDTDDSESAHSEHSLTISTDISPLSSIRHNQSLASDTRHKNLQLYPIELGRKFILRPNDSLGPGLSFHIHTESLHTQLHAETSARPPVNFEHDDKENLVTNPDLEPTPYPHDSIRVQSATEYRQHVEDEGEGDITQNEFELLIESFDHEFPGRIPDADGAADDCDDDDDDVVELKRELDSAFKKMSPEDSIIGENRGPHPVTCRDDECDSVLGFPSSGDTVTRDRQLINLISPSTDGIEEATTTK